MPTDGTLGKKKASLPAVFGSRIVSMKMQDKFEGKKVS